MTTMRFSSACFAVLLGTLSWSSLASAAPLPPQLVSDLSPGSGSSFPEWGVVSGGDLFFAAGLGGNDTEVFRSDGTAAHTTKLSNIAPAKYIDGASRLFLAGSKICFDGQGGLWATDGTVAGTSIITPNLRDLRELGRTPFLDPRIPYGGRTFIIATHPTQTIGLWSTDGTSAGTKLIAPATTVLGVAGAGAGRVMFNNLATLRATDGTTTTDVATTGQYVERVGELGTTLYFTIYFGSNKFELWKTDGTAAGTRKVKTLTYRSDIPAPPQPGVADDGSGTVARVHDGKLYFVIGDSDGTKKIWFTDGTDAGTQLVGSTFTESLVEVGGKLFFDFADPAAGHELHAIATGSTTPTLVADLVPGPDGSYPTYLTVWQGKAAFVVREPVARVYTTDGVTITPFGGPISTPDFAGGTILGVSAKALFLSGYDATHGEELWAAVDPDATQADAGAQPPHDGGTSKDGGGHGSSGANADDAGPDDGTPPSTDEVTSTSSGCTAAGSTSEGLTGLLAIGLVMLGARRRWRGASTVSGTRRS